MWGQKHVRRCFGGGGGGVHIVSGIQFRRVEIPNGGHKVSKGGQMPPPPH